MSTRSANKSQQMDAVEIRLKYRVTTLGLVDGQGNVLMATRRLRGTRDRDEVSNAAERSTTKGQCRAAPTTFYQTQARSDAVDGKDPAAAAEETTRTEAGPDRGKKDQGRRRNGRQLRLAKADA